MHTSLVTLSWDNNIYNNYKRNKCIMTSINKFTLNNWISIAMNIAEALSAPFQSNATNYTQLCYVERGVASSFVSSFQPRATLGVSGLL